MGLCYKRQCNSDLGPIGQPQIRRVQHALIQLEPQLDEGDHLRECVALRRKRHHRPMAPRPADDSHTDAL